MRSEPHNIVRTGIFLMMLIALLGHISPARSKSPDHLGPVWLSTDEKGEKKLRLYFFHSPTCPHCAEAKVFLEQLTKIRPWLKVETRSVENEENIRLFFMLAREFKREPEAVPSFFLCGRMIVGYDNELGVGVQLGQTASSCHQKYIASSHMAPGKPSDSAVSAAPQTRTVNIPFVGGVDPGSLSLPALTILLGGLDAFNPCAFFVLLFLLSLIVNVKSRTRMAIVGGTFVVISGLMYFLFMAAWLNLFLVLDNVKWITLGAGIIAVLIGVMGVKDYFLFHRGPSLSITEDNKQKLFTRIASLISVDHLPTLLTGTIALAIAANMYELLCTSGFPLVFTRILTLHDLPDSTRYAYLVLYNIVYVLPLLAIVAFFIFTLGRRKLTEREGRTLKLLSGCIMLSMGLILLFNPGAFDNVLTAIGVLMVALLVTTIISFVGRKQSPAGLDG